MGTMNSDTTRRFRQMQVVHYHTGRVISLFEKRLRKIAENKIVSSLKCYIFYFCFFSGGCVLEFFIIFS